MLSRTGGLDVIFISYAGEDRARAFEIVARLKAEGVECWIDRESIPVGARWMRAIVEAIRSCDGLIVLLSSAVDTSPWVPAEVVTAVSLSKPVIPVRLVPYEPGDDIRLALTLRNWVDAFGDEQATFMARLIGAIRDPSPRTPMPAQAARPGSDPLAAAWVAAVRAQLPDQALGQAVLARAMGLAVSHAPPTPELIDTFSRDEGWRRRALLTLDDPEIAAVAVNPSNAAVHQALYALAARLPIERTIAGIPFRLIPPGTSPTALRNHQAFYLAQRPLSDHDWQTNVRERAGDATRAHAPTCALDATRLCERPGCRGLRLPTSNQWRFALDAGGVAEPSNLDGPYLGRGRANSLGLDDMLFVVWQWCRTERGFERRGGCWCSYRPPVTSAEPAPVPGIGPHVEVEHTGVRLAADSWE